MLRRVLLFWSSGKDSAWTFHVLRQQPEVDLVCLLTTFNEAVDPVPVQRQWDSSARVLKLQIESPVYP